MVEFSIRCTCGSLTAVASDVSPTTVNRVVCHCLGCRAYAQVLGRASDILDQRGLKASSAAPQRGCG